MIFPVVPTIHIVVLPSVVELLSLLFSSLWRPLCPLCPGFAPVPLPSLPAVCRSSLLILFCPSSLFLLFTPLPHTHSYPFSPFSPWFTPFPPFPPSFASPIFPNWRPPSCSPFPHSPPCQRVSPFFWRLCLCDLFYTCVCVAVEWSHLPNLPNTSYRPHPTTS